MIFGAAFFYRWNDGKDNVFSAAYKLQLRFRDALFGNLSNTQKSDLDGRQHETTPTANTSSTRVDLPPENVHMYMERPKRHHIIESEKIRQERDEAILRAVDIAEAQLSKEKTKKSWKFW